MVAGGMALSTKQLPPVLLARMVLTIVAWPPVSKAPALPAPALLPENVQLVTVTVPLLEMAPPSLAAPALLPEKVQSVTARVPLLAMAPPASPALLPEKVELVTVRVPAW